jgi:ketosteroid isomerase-like protein
VTGPGVGRRAALPVLALALGLAAPGRSAAQAPPAPEPVRVAEAFTAAWNAHDLPAVLALFAPDAVVRERQGPVPPHVWDTRDRQVVRAYLEVPRGGRDDVPSPFVWVTGHQEIAAWAAARFALRHRYAVGPPCAIGDTVGWPYREFIDPFQLAPGFGPSEGDAEAVVRGGRIAVLSLVQTLESVLRRWDEAHVVAARVTATQRAAPPGDGPSGRLSGPPRGEAEPTGAGWPLALSGLALLAGAAAAVRRRRPS